MGCHSGGAHWRVTGGVALGSLGSLGSASEVTNSRRRLLRVVSAGQCQLPLRTERPTCLQHSARIAYALFTWHFPQDDIDRAARKHQLGERPRTAAELAP